MFILFGIKCELKIITWSWFEGESRDLVFCTYIRQVKGAIGVKDNWEDSEDELQDCKLEGAQFEQEESASGVGEEEKDLQFFSRNMDNYHRRL